MARGNRGNGPRGGFRGGRGGGRGRGGGGGRGRGRGDSMDDTDFSIHDWANNAPRGGSSNSGFNTPRGRGKGRGSGYNTPQRGNSTPQRGFQTPRGRGRPQYTPLDAYDDVGGMGRGRGSPTDNRARGRGGKNLASKLRAGAPLSKLLYEDRPLLRPIVFVRSVHTATLFEEKEDLLQPLSEEVTNDEQSHVPTADRVTQVFSGTAEDGESSDEEEQLEEIDFTEIGRIQAEVDAAAADKTQVAAQVEVIEEKFTGFFVDTQPGPVNHTAMETEGSREVLGDDDEEIIVYVAPHPRAGPVTPPAEEADPMAEPMEVSSASILTGRPLEEATSETVELRASHAALQSEPLSEAAASVAEGSTEAETQAAADIEQTEETIPARMDVVETEGSVAEVAVESSQRIEAVTPSQPSQVENTETQNGHASTPPALAEVSFAFKSTTTTTKLARRFHPTRTPRSLIKKNKVRRKSLRGSFGLFGAQLEEAHLRERDPREHERRIGDSDLDWGDGDSDTKDAVEELSTGVGDMQIDDDLDVNAMASFVKSMSAEGSRQVTMDDVADTQRMREEDKEDDDDDDEYGTSSEEDVELEQIIRHEEETMIAEDALEDSDDDDLSSSDEEGTPGRSFQRRLERIRKNAEGKRPAKAADPQDNVEDDDDDDDFEMELEQSWAEDDEDFIAHMQNIIDQNEALLTGKDRKNRNKLFRSIQNGDWDIDDYEELMGIQTPKRKKSKPQGITPELEAQWQKDRDKKAENKRKRALARLEAAADPLAPKKGGKKGMKAMLAAARYDGPEELPNRVVDLVSLEQQIRRFLRDIGGPNSMSLPPASKDTRKKIHELADAFSLKSQSKGSGDRRYTTLTKTTKSGLNVNEKKVRRIMRGVAGYQWEGPGKGSGRTKTMSLAKHNEGEEVGKAAPKIGDTNIGFKMLASMGWAEGDRIGLSGGLDAPLTAKMKKTKLGLGATL